MFFKEFLLPALGHASYLVGDEATGKGLVADPRPNVDVDFDAARAEGLRVAYAGAVREPVYDVNWLLSPAVELRARRRDLFGAVRRTPRRGGRDNASLPHAGGEDAVEYAFEQESRRSR